MLGALSVLQSCGFERVKYPDGYYWTMRKVDVKLLQEVRLELDAGLRALA